MISPVSSAPAVYTSSVSAAQPQSAKQPVPHDSVHLSAQALATAAGDADHDGDSR